MTSASVRTDYQTDNNNRVIPNEVKDLGPLIGLLACAACAGPVARPEILRPEPQDDTPRCEEKAKQGVAK